MGNILFLAVVQYTSSRITQVKTTILLIWLPNNGGIQRNFELFSAWSNSLNWVKTVEATRAVHLWCFCKKLVGFSVQGSRLVLSIFHWSRSLIRFDWSFLMEELWKSKIIQQEHDPRYIITFSATVIQWCSVCLWFRNTVPKFKCFTKTWKT